MSVVRQLIRVAVVEAWRGNTIALENVFDSKIDTLNGLLKGSHVPVLIFSIEEEDFRSAGQSAGLTGRDSRLTCMVQAAVASGRAIQDGTGTVVVPAIGETDAALEARLDMLSWQWRAVMADMSNPWVELFHALVVSIGSLKDQRAFDPETGTKHASRFWQFEADVMSEPVPGEPLNDTIEKGLALLEADPEYAELAGKWRQLLSADSDRPDWRVLQSELFASRADMAALGHGPLVIDDLVDFDQAVLDVEGTGQTVIT